MLEPGTVTILVRPPGGGGTGYHLSSSKACILVGRGAGCDVRLPSAAVSASHARIVRDGDTVSIEDAGSHNGTIVDGERLVPQQRRPLPPGAVADICGYRIQIVEAARTGQSDVRSGGPSMAGAEGTASLARALAREAIATLSAASTEGAAAFVVQRGIDRGQRFELPDAAPFLLVGRADHCHVRLTDADVSREHARVTRAPGRTSIEDIASKNGVELNGERIVEARMLADRDLVGVGGTVLRYEDPVERLLRQLAGEAPDLGDLPGAEPSDKPDPPPVETAPDAPESTALAAPLPPAPPQPAIAAPPPPASAPPSPAVVLGGARQKARAARPRPSIILYIVGGTLALSALALLALLLRS